MKPDSAPFTIPTERIEAICRRNGVREMALFGSALRGPLSPDSDVDLLVEFAPDTRIGFFGLATLQRELSEIFGRRVDLVSKGGLNPLIRDEILTQRKVIYAA